MLTPIDHETHTKQVDSIVQSLQTRLAAEVDISVIAAEVESELVAYSTARVTRFVPILVERSVLARLLPAEVRIVSATGRRTRRRVRREASS